MALSDRVEYGGLWFPNDGTLTRALRARIDEEKIYRIDRLAEALAHVRDFSLAIDCGAHVGSWTTVLANRFRRVIAIEPNPQNFACLKWNTECFDNVDALNIAAGECARAVKVASGKSAMASQIAIDGTAVEMQTIDGLNVSACGYIKFHVNGYELPALMGAEQTLKRCRPVLTVVFKPRLEQYGYTAEALRDWIIARDYREAGGEAPYRIFVPA